MTNFKNLYQLAYQSLLDLAHEEGINASGKDEVFGCIFGRDSAVTILKILKTQKRQPSESLLQISKKALLNLITLQGKEVNLESGEEPGKFIHEFRRTKFDHLVNTERPWYIYPDNTLRNYDSIDSTPLTLIALHKYWEVTGDSEFLITILPAVETGLNWIITFGDRDKDQLLEYEFSSQRKHGGLTIQSWTDSYQSLVDRSGNLPKYPIAPIEVQAFAWLALKLWADVYYSFSPTFARKIASFAKKLKEKFNSQFITKDQDLFFGAQALDGDKRQIQTITANPLLCLWAAYRGPGGMESILDPIYLDHFVQRTFKSDLFIKDAGIRTMSSLSPTFNPNQDSYHNGSFWPVLNGLILEGLKNFGFYEHALKLKKAALQPILYFGCPIELYIQKEGYFFEYCSPSGQLSCKHQAWSAATILDLATDPII